MRSKYEISRTEIGTIIRGVSLNEISAKLPEGLLVTDLSGRRKARLTPIGVGMTGKPEVKVTVTKNGQTEEAYYVDGTGEHIVGNEQYGFVVRHHTM